MTEYNIEPFAIDYHNIRLSGFKAEKVAKNKIVFAGCSMYLSLDYHKTN